MSLILRHKPEVIRTQLDAHGWADVNALPAGIGKKYPINRDILEEIVRSDSKQRYAFNEDRTLIQPGALHPSGCRTHRNRAAGGAVPRNGPAVFRWRSPPIGRYPYLGDREKALQTAKRLATERLWPGRHRFRPMSFFEDPNLRELLLEPESLRRIR